MWTFPDAAIGAHEHAETLHEATITREMNQTEGVGCPCGNEPFSPWDADADPRCWACLQREETTRAA